MKRGIDLDDLAALYRKAAAERDATLQGMVFEAAQQLAVAEGAEAFVGEASRLIADEVRTAEAAAVQAAEASIAEVTALGAHDVKAAKASAAGVFEFSVGENVALEAAETLAVRMADAEATYAQSMEVTQTLHQFLKKL